MNSGSRSKNIDSTSNNLSDKNDSDGKKGSASSNGKNPKLHENSMFALIKIVVCSEESQV